MFTPQKIFFLILILAIVWGVYRVIERRNKTRDNLKADKPKEETVTLKQCASCGDWVDASCSKPGCPIKS